MNILPKKRWHVRTKDNIARVRKDEAEAREQERKRQDKLELAESEARINFLRKQSGLPERQHTAAEADPVGTAPTGPDDAQHVDLFADYRSHIKTTNKDLEREKKEEQEKYEKQIGYLTYLGQDTNEALKLRSWYEKAPTRASVGEKDVVEKDLKIKYSHDPLTLINALLPPEKPAKRLSANKRPRSPSVVSVVKVSNAVEQAKLPKVKKHKKEKKHKKDKNRKKDRQRKDREAAKLEEEQRKKERLERLRKERLRREAAERVREEALTTPKEQNHAATKTAPASTTTAPTPRIVQKYNSQFNPELAKQNQL